MSPVPVRITSAPEWCRQKRMAPSWKLPTPWLLSSAVNSAMLDPDARSKESTRARARNGRSAYIAMIPVPLFLAAGAIDEIEPDHDRVEDAARGGAHQHGVLRIALEGFGDSDRSYLALFLQSQESRQQPLESRGILRRRDTMQAKNVEIVCSEPP